MESYPRDELLQTNAEELLETCLEVLRLSERRRTRLFLRPDVYGRFMSCLVYLPRDRYNTAVRLKMETILRRAFHAESVDFSTRVGESALARLHFVVRVPRGHVLPQVDVADLEREVVEATRTWEEDLAEATRTELGEEAGARLVGPLRSGLPRGVQGGLPPPGRGRRPAPDGGAHRRGLGRAGALPRARRAGRRAPLQALPPRSALAHRGPAAVHPPRRRGRRRAPVRGPPGRRRHRPRLRLRPARGAAGGLHRGRARDLPAAAPGRLPGRVARAGGVGRVQRARPRRRPDLAPGRRAARGGQVPAPDPLDLLAGLRRGRARLQRRPRPPARRAVRDPVRPDPVRRRGR